MTRVTRWTLGVVVALVPFGIVLPSIAQRAGEPKQGSSDLDRAKEMAQLIEEGQLTLRDACVMAEKHCKGTALEVRSTIQPGATAQPGAPRGEPTPGARAEDEDRSDQKDPKGRRLVYQVNCFAKDKLEIVRVDALERKVIGADEPDERGGSENKDRPQRP